MTFRHQMLIACCSLILTTLPAFAPATHPFSSVRKDFRPGKDVALFFAVSNYAAWPKLQNPVKEAEAIARELRDHYGFSTEVVKDPTKAQIQAKIEEYRAKTFADDAQLFIYFTGHGEYLESTREGFFIPKDARRGAG
ncbi:MAG: caspase family protein [Saprospiraceae bacterium]